MYRQDLVRLNTLRPQTHLPGQEHAQRHNKCGDPNSRARHAQTPHSHLGGGELEQSERGDQDHAESRAPDRSATRARELASQEDHGRDRRAGALSDR